MGKTTVEQSEKTKMRVIRSLVCPSLFAPCTYNRFFSNSVGRRDRWDRWDRWDLWDGFFSPAHLHLALDSDRFFCFISCLSVASQRGGAQLVSHTSLFLYWRGYFKMVASGSLSLVQGTAAEWKQWKIRTVWEDEKVWDECRGVKCHRVGFGSVLLIVEREVRQGNKYRMSFKNVHSVVQVTVEVPKSKEQQKNEQTFAEKCKKKKNGNTWKTDNNFKHLVHLNNSPKHKRHLRIHPQPHGYLRTVSFFEMRSTNLSCGLASPHCLPCDVQRWIIFQTQT